MMIDNFGSIYLTVKIYSGSALTDDDCRGATTVEIYGNYLTYFYLLSICYEIYKINKNPLNNQYSSRSNFYHTASQSIAIIIMIVNAVICDWSPDPHGAGCFLMDYKSDVYFILAP